MGIRRRMAAIVVVLLSLVFEGIASAQGGPVPPGEPAGFVDVAGVDHGTVTVLEILDPYTGYPEGKGPEAGTRFVIVTMAFEGAAEEGFELWTPYVYLQDATGALWTGSLPCCITDDFPQPELSITTITPGSRITGFMGFTLPDDAVVQAIVFGPASGVLLFPADLGSARPAIDTPVTVLGADDEQMVATVTKVEDPFKAFDKDQPPADGARYVMLTASFENTGASPITFETGGVLLRDVRGALWAPVEVAPAKKPKTPVLASVAMGPGNRITGRLGFQVPKDVELEAVYYQGGGHLTRVAALSDVATGPTAGGTATCADVAPWWADVGPILQRLAALPPFQADAAPMDAEASQAMLADLELIVSDHLAVTPPDVLVGPHRRFLAALLLFTASARDQVASQEGSDPAALFRSQETFAAAMLTMDTALGALDEAGLADCTD